jgi:hypothetical protein
VLFPDMFEPLTFTRSPPTPSRTSFLTAVAGAISG